MDPAAHGSKVYADKLFALSVCPKTFGVGKGCQAPPYFPEP
jgi:hypothetical protein